jgi:DNA-binding SARP family transcriptional activator
VIDNEHPLPGTAHDAARTTRLRVEILDHFRVLAGAADVLLPASAERIVGYLAVTDRAQSRESIACALWPDRTDADALATVRRALWRLNRGAPDLIERSGPYLSINASVDVDVRELRATAAEISTGAVGRIAPDSVRLFVGDLLPQWADEWLDGPRESLRQLRLHALETLARACLAADRPGDALTLALAAVSVDPLRESAQRIVISAHLLEDNGAAALQHFAHYRDLLWTEMQLRPSKQLQALLADACGSARVVDTLREHVPADHAAPVRALHQVRANTASRG